MKKDLTRLITLKEFKDYINSKDFDLFALEDMLSEHKGLSESLFVGSAGNCFITDGKEKITIQEDDSIDIVEVTPENIERADIQAYIYTEAYLKNNTVVVLNNGEIMPLTGEKAKDFLFTLDVYPEPVEMSVDLVKVEYQQALTEWYGNKTDLHLFVMNNVVVPIEFI